MKAFPLYLTYAVRSFLRGRTRSLFGVFCVAVGVASVVALGLVGANFQDAVTGNAQKINRGDVSVSFPESIGSRDYSYFAGLKARGEIVDYTPRLFADAVLRPSDPRSTTSNVGSLVAIDAKKFPFYDTVTAVMPAGKPLSALLTHPNDGVVSQYIYDSFHLHIGGTMKVVFRYGGSKTLTIRGVVPADAPDKSFGLGLFPYWVMTDRSTVATYMRNNNFVANDVYMKTTNAAQADRVKADITRRFGDVVSPKTVADVQNDQRNSAQGMNTFFHIMGLVSIVIGGIGIVNTMLVAARRRLTEIAVLKSVGMKSRQVILVFTLESLILAIAGGVLGVALGVAGSAVVNSITQSMSGFAIPWGLHAGPMLGGFVVGLVFTVLFAYLPVLRASRARPIAALRGAVDPVKRRWFRLLVRSLRAHPGRTLGSGIRRAPHGLMVVIKAQRLRTGLMALVLAAVMGYVGVLYAGLASGAKTVVMGAAVGIGLLVGAGILTQVFVVIVWLVSKLPSMGRLSTRMAFRSMGTQKRRLASTLLALCVGILAMSSIAILAQNLKHELAQSIQRHQSFNVAIQAPHKAATIASIDGTVRGLPGVEHRYQGAIANDLQLSAVNGIPLNQVIHRALTERNKDGSLTNSKDTVQQAIGSIRGLAGRDSRVVADAYQMSAGRNLAPRDAGTDHIVVSQQFADPFGIKVGSRVTYSEPGRSVPFTVVGIASSSSFMILSNTVADLGYMQAAGLTTPSSSHNALIYLQVRNANLKDDVTTLRQRVPGGLVLDINSFMQYLSVIDKLALFPEIIAALTLFAGVTIIANTVALAMLERRREIGVIKAVGARRRTILQFLLVENAIVGFLGAAVGVGLAMIAATLVDHNMLQVSTSFDWPTIAGLIVVGMVLAIGASALTALPASSEKPLTVLRYE